MTIAADHEPAFPDEFPMEEISDDRFSHDVACAPHGICLVVYCHGQFQVGFPGIFARLVKTVISSDGFESGDIL